MILWAYLLTCICRTSAVGSECVDQDDVLRGILQQQYGAGRSCAELAAEMQGVCNDERIAKLCCRQCRGEEERDSAIIESLRSSQAETVSFEIV